MDNIYFHLGVNKVYARLDRLPMGLGGEQKTSFFDSHVSKHVIQQLSEAWYLAGNSYLNLPKQHMPIGTGRGVASPQTVQSCAQRPLVSSA